MFALVFLKILNAIGINLSLTKRHIYMYIISCVQQKNPQETILITLVDKKVSFVDERSLAKHNIYLVFVRRLATLTTGTDFNHLNDK